MKKKLEISVVIPLYRCSNTIEELYLRLIKVFLKLDISYEVILINDASPENDWEVASKLSEQYKEIKSINLSRNFGQHPAIFCGLEHSKGEWVVVMDGDLQDVPEEIEKLYNKAIEGFDKVHACRVNRKDSWLKTKTSYFFYSFLNYFTDNKLNHEVGNFGLYSRKVIDSILSMGDHIKFFYSMVSWVGYSSTSVEVQHEKRQVGKSSYSYYKLFTLAFDAIISFSNKPLKIVVKFGFIMVFVSISMIVYNLYKYMYGQVIVLGYISIIVSMWFLSGVILIVLGVLGIYLGKIFDKVKDRPSYIVKEII